MCLGDWTEELRLVEAMMLEAGIPDKSKSKTNTLAAHSPAGEFCPESVG